jgi:hypothetical protein
LKDTLRQALYSGEVPKARLTSLFSRIRDRFKKVRFWKRFDSGGNRLRRFRLFEQNGHVRPVRDLIG